MRHTRGGWLAWSVGSVSMPSSSVAVAAPLAPAPGFEPEVPEPELEPELDPEPEREPELEGVVDPEPFPPRCW